MAKHLAIILPLALLAACGSKNEKQGDGAAATPEASAEVKAPSGPLTDIKNKVACSTVKGQHAPEGAPADDVLGIRSGTSLEDAKQILTCANNLYVYSENEGTWSRGDEKPTQRFLRLSGDGGLDDVFVDFAGPKGTERAVRMIRSIEYAEGTEQTVEGIKTSLEQKYGKFEELRGYRSNYNTGSIVYSIDGQRLGINNSDFDRCSRGAGFGASDSAALTNCGLVVNYNIEARPNDSAVTQRFTVTVFDSMAAQRLMDGIDATRKAAAEKPTEGPRL